MKYIPHLYQKRAIQWVLQNPAAGLLLDVGMGKTSIVLAALRVLLEKQVIDSALVLAPIHVCHRVWPNEIQKWDLFKDMKFTVLHGADKKERLQEDSDLFIINYEGLKWLEQQQEWSWPDMLIVDESSRLKNTQTKRFKMLKPHLKDFSRRIILTGTPIPNGLMDLFGQVYVLDLGERLGRYITHYRSKFFIQSGFMGYEWRPLPEAEAEIHRRIGDICMRLEAADYLEMPEKIETHIELTLPKTARELYQKLETEFLVQLDDRLVLASNAATLSGKLRQVGNGAVYTLSEVETANDKEPYSIVHDEKLDALESLIEEIGQPTIVVYEFRHDKERILERLKKMKVRAEVIGSKVSPKKVARTIDEWNRGEVPVLVIYPGSAGHGLNLQQGGNHMIWFGLNWNLEYVDQTIGRIYRQGQENRVHIYYLIVKDSMDAAVLAALKRKTRTQTALLDALKKWRKKRKKR